MLATRSVLDVIRAAAAVAEDPRKSLYVLSLLEQRGKGRLVRSRVSSSFPPNVCPSELSADLLQPCLLTEGLQVGE